MINKINLNFNQNTQNPLKVTKKIQKPLNQNKSIGQQQIIQQQKEQKNSKQLQQEQEKTDKNIQNLPDICLGKYTDDIAEKMANSYKNGLTKEQILQLDQQGYLVIPNILNKQQCLQAISELWDVLESVPHKPEFQLKRPSNPLGELSKSQQKEYSKNWVPWKGYGMLSEPPSFHTETHWKLRQNEYLYNIYSQILQTEKLWASIDRASVKLPKEGIEEFNHWDFDPWNPTKATVQGIVNLSQRSFRCVPGSNTEKWHTEFKKNYKYLESKNLRSTVQLNEKEPDPWKLAQIIKNKQYEKPKTEYSCIHDIVCPQGSIVLFSQRVMHSVAKNQSDKISYGLYLTFGEAGNKLTHAVNNKRACNIHAKEGDTERADRIRSYQQGTAPYKYMCGAGIFQYIIPRTINIFRKKRTEESLRLHPNSQNPYILEHLPKNYKPPQLNSLGRKLLGLDLYEDMNEQPMKLSEQDKKKLNQKQNQ